MKYLGFVRSSEKHREAQPPASMMEALGKIIEKLTKEPALVDTEGLLPSNGGFRMRLANGKLTTTTTTTDGPFTKSKKVMACWAILEVGSKAESLRLTTELMQLHREHWPELEGRPIELQAQA